MRSMTQVRRSEGQKVRRSGGQEVRKSGVGATVADVSESGRMVLERVHILHRFIKGHEVR